MKIYKVNVAGTIYEVQVESVEQIDGHLEVVKEEKEITSTDETEVLAPMQGVILKSFVVVGSKVNKGDVLFILEAMKMENEILSPVSGIVTNVLVSHNQTVNTNQLLITIN